LIACIGGLICELRCSLVIEVLGRFWDFIFHLLVYCVCGGKRPNSTGEEEKEGGRGGGALSLSLSLSLSADEDRRTDKVCEGVPGENLPSVSFD